VFWIFQSFRTKKIISIESQESTRPLSLVLSCVYTNTESIENTITCYIIKEIVINFTDIKGKINDFRV